MPRRRREQNVLLAICETGFMIKSFGVDALDCAKGADNTLMLKTLQAPISNFEEMRRRRGKPLQFAGRTHRR